MGLFGDGDKKDIPIPFLTVNDSGYFELHPKAKKVIGKVKGKVGVVCVAGLYRTGKSYVLNRLLGRQHGFEVGATVNACTKGIYTWGRPIQTTNEDGEEITLILMDTEGIGSLEQDQTHDSKILSISVLLSSLFVYNSMGVIDENALEKISFIANLTKHIHVHTPNPSDAKAKDAREMAPYFPHFIWLLRDFGLKLVDPKGNPITESDYLENALSQMSKDDSKNDTRKAILNSFTRRDCITLVRPVVDEDELQDLDNIPYEKLRDKFRLGMDKLIDLVYKKVKPKLVFGKPINGQAFLVLVETYITAINTGAVPTIKTAWDNVSELECKSAMEYALNAYVTHITQHIDPKLPIEDEEIYTWHLGYKEFPVLAEYNQRAIGDHFQEYRDKLEAALQQEFQSLLRKNDSRSEKLCAQLLGNLYVDIDDRIQKQHYDTLTDLVTDWKRLENRYNSEARGRYKYICLSQFVMSRLPDGMVTMAMQQSDNLRNKYESQLTEARKEIREEREEGRKLINEFNAERKQLQEKLQKFTEDIKNMERGNKELSSENRSLQEEVDRLSKELHEAGENLEKIQGNAQKLDKGIKQLQEEKSSLLEKTDQLQNTIAQQRKNKCAVM